MRKPDDADNGTGLVWRIFVPATNTSNPDRIRPTRSTHRRSTTKRRQPARPTLGVTGQHNNDTAPADLPRRQQTPAQPSDGPHRRHAQTGYSRQTAAQPSSQQHAPIAATPAQPAASTSRRQRPCRYGPCITPPPQVQTEELPLLIFRQPPRPPRIRTQRPRREVLHRRRPGVVLVQIGPQDRRPQPRRHLITPALNPRKQLQPRATSRQTRPAHAAQHPQT